MTTFHGLDDFRALLIAEGWRISRNNLASQHNSCDWYAWRPERIEGPECVRNGKPPALMVWPHIFADEQAVPINAGSYELEVCGEAPGGAWLKLRAYALSPAEFSTAYPLASRQLIAAWRAACEA